MHDELDARTATTSSGSATALDPALIGTWGLVSAEDLVDGEWVPYTFGNPPAGYFIYDATGHASVQIMTTPPVTLSDPDNGPTPDEALQIFNSYIGYFGPWSTAAGMVTVVPVGAMDPSQVDSPQTRPYTVVGDTLTIGNRAKGYIRTLKRLT
jgi:hypothetical protein